MVAIFSINLADSCHDSFVMIFESRLLYLKKSQLSVVSSHCQFQVFVAVVAGIWRGIKWGQSVHHRSQELLYNIFVCVYAWYT